MRRASGVFLALVVSTLAGATSEQQRPDTGVVVEEVGRNSGGERAGVQVGDVLLSWTRVSSASSQTAMAKGTFRSVFDATRVRWEQSPRGQLRIAGARRGKPLSIDLMADDWGIQTRPQMAAEVSAQYLEGKRLVDSKSVKPGAELWQAAAQNIARTSPELAAWLCEIAGEALSGARDWEGADRAFDRAMDYASNAASPFLSGKIWYDRASTLRARQNWDASEAAFERARDVWKSAFGDSLLVAAATANIAGVENTRGNLLKSDALENEALAIRERVAPESLPVAASLSNLGSNAFDRGASKEAEVFHRRALAIRERLSPGTMAVAASLNNLGNAADMQGNLDRADALHKRALAIRQDQSPDGLDVSTSLNNLGIIAKKRGDLETAESFYRRSLAIRMTLVPESMMVAASLGNLGRIAEQRGNLAEADRLYRQTLAIGERLAPGRIFVAVTLLNLGNVARERGDLISSKELISRALETLEKLESSSVELATAIDDLGMNAMLRGDYTSAEGCCTRSIEMLSKIAPISLDMAGVLTNCGFFEKTRNNTAEAESRYTQALSLYEQLGPDTLDTAEVLINLGTMALDRGDLPSAETFYRRSLAVRERAAPGTAQEADSLYALGLVERQRRNTVSAAGYFKRAIEALEKQRGTLGGSEDLKAGFTAKYADYYHAYIEVLLELKLGEDAFQTLERSRARSLLSMLAERDLVFSADIPADLERERKTTDAQYDQLQNRIGGLNPSKDAEAIETLSSELRELRTKQNDIIERIKKASPRLASLQYPRPFDVEGTQNALDPGTALLAYSIGTEKSLLFVVRSGSKGDPVVYWLAVGEKGLRESVEAFRNLIGFKGSRSQAPTTTLIARGRSLYDLLVKPAEKLIGASDRVLILPDGPLHTLPFDALVKDVKSGKPQYLVEWKPLHTAVSATVYAELKKERRAAPASAPVVVAAFGDPKYPSLTEGKSESGEEDPGLDPQVRLAVRGGYRLDSLPATRQEVEMIANLYAPRAVTYLGEEATEEKAKAIGKDTPFVHFACHGILNERFPLDSALALTIPERPAEGQDNGLLQAWEIFEKVRIDADLVTLSACETGLGKEMGGEGLVGLTRAFQYAGARSVLASLWKVEDESTQELMKRFYGYLKAGKTKDEALRLAQIDLIHSPNFSQPSQWAAFQLNGDWK